MRTRLSSVSRRSLAATAAAAIGPALVAGPAWAGTAQDPAATLSFHVNSTADSRDASPGDGRCADRAGRCTLRAAVEEASAQPAGTSISISVPAGTYRLTLGSLEEPANTIAITGAAPSSTVVEAGGSFRVLRVDPGVTASLAKLTITGGNAGPSGYGGGVLSSGELAISGSTVSANTATAGGGVANSGGRLTISGSTISGNHGTDYGGGGIQNGGLKNRPGTVTVTSSTVSGNTTGGDGGGILNGQNGHPAAAVRARAAATRRSRAAASRLGLTVTDSKISNNTSGNSGGGIANDGGTAAITGSTLKGNSTPHAIGGGIETYGPLTVTGSTLTGNTARGGYGGGIEAYYGGVPGTVRIADSTLSGNRADIGGGIDDSAAVSVTQSTLSGNSARKGGGIFVEGSSEVSVRSSTLAGNTASVPGSGGGIQTYACGRGTVSYTTIAGNSTGLDLSCPDVQLTGTIVASSTAGANCPGSAPAESAGYNLDSGKSCGFTKPADLHSTNPKLGPLTGNGGPTLTEPPRPGSPAINHGGRPANGCPATDQRGLPRPSGPACDIGSVEVQG
jgi:large repetitive protein